MEKELFEFIGQFIELTEEEKDTLRELQLFQNFEKDELLVKEGQFSKKSFMVMKGCLRSYILKDGEEKTIAFYTEGEGFSPADLNKASENNIICMEDCILSVSTPDMEQEIFTKFPKFESMCRVFTEQLLSQNQTDFAKFMSSTPEERYQNLLETKPDLVQRVPQYHIASYLGIKPESLSRIRKRLTKI